MKFNLEAAERAVAATLYTATGVPSGPTSRDWSLSEVDGSPVVPAAIHGPVGPWVALGRLGPGMLEEIKRLQLEVTRLNGDNAAFLKINQIQAQSLKEAQDENIRQVAERSGATLTGLGGAQEIERLQAEVVALKAEIKIIAGPSSLGICQFCAAKIEPHCNVCKACDAEQSRVHSARDE